MAWESLIVAGLLEVVWAIALKRAAGAPSVSLFVVVGVAMAGSVGLLGLALRRLPVGTAYAAWVGIGTVGTAVVGIVVMGESARPARLVCLAIIAAAVAGLHSLG